MDKDEEMEPLLAELEAELEKALAAAEEFVSETVSDELDPSVGVPWMRCSPGLRDYIKRLERNQRPDTEADGVVFCGGCGRAK